MLRLRPKPESDSSREWSCCFCFHVRTGTVLLGIWHLMLHLVALGFLAAITRDPRLLEEFEQDSLAISRNTPFGTHGTRDHNLVYHDIDVGALVTICTLAVTLMLIYGASRGKPTHLLPFFCLQIFDFAITVLTVTGYLCYLQSIHRLVQETKRVPWREELLALPPAALALIVLSFFMTAVLLKAYFISIVWRCYKYLTIRSHGLDRLSPFVISTDGVVVPPAPAYSGPPPAPDYSSLLPDYEEAVKQTPPPSYRAATLMTADPANAADPNQAAKEDNQPQVTNTMVMLPPNGAQARV
ncbi:lysosomal-associated transmembrane protein 4A isoform X2 [Bicyclus anynana]|uniref:Lysosomal-associated transmembrane protein 4A isoform X2 n=1 Tax=Bicyclus anynana TaxID=110368 RepID=A0ABM3LQ72_BICAN|nr:lysosomal-associated transmembrane protein 4A isoform X2 [Bicyclus anynana]